MSEDFKVGAFTHFQPIAHVPDSICDESGILTPQALRELADNDTNRFEAVHTSEQMITYPDRSRVFLYADPKAPDDPRKMISVIQKYQNVWIFVGLVVGSETSCSLEHQFGCCGDKSVLTVEPEAVIDLGNSSQTRDEMMDFLFGTDDLIIMNDTYLVQAAAYYRGVLPAAPAPLSFPVPQQYIDYNNFSELPPPGENQ